VREWNAQFGETSNALVGIDEFQDAFPEEDTARHESEGEDAAGTISWWIEKPREEFVYRGCSLQLSELASPKIIP
jgi:hypothetical protein